MLQIFFRGGSNVHWVSHDYGELAGLLATSRSLSGMSAGPLVGVVGAVLPRAGCELAYSSLLFRRCPVVHWCAAGDTYEKVEGPDGHLGVATIRLHPTEPDWVRRAPQLPFQHTSG